MGREGFAVEEVCPGFVEESGGGTEGVRMGDEGPRVAQGEAVLQGGGTVQVVGEEGRQDEGCDAVGLEEPPVAETAPKLRHDHNSSSTAPSSPRHIDSAVFSDPPISAQVSPPSSPPPRLVSPKKDARKPTFSFLKRKRDECESTSNKLEKAPREIVPKKKVKVTQMQIDIGGETRKKCTICNMEYIPSNGQDARLHKDFCNSNDNGIYLAHHNPATKRSNGKFQSTGLEAGGGIIIIDTKSSKANKADATKVLEFVNAELGAADMDDEVLWGGKSMRPKERSVETGDRKQKGHQFKMFLYLDGSKCVGACLAEKISKARKVDSGENGEENLSTETPDLESSSISTSTSIHNAYLGISRIWTAKSHRRKGIAMELMDCARRKFYFGFEVPKELVAFSQPTESGGQLARSWFRNDTEWLVYDEDP